MLVASVKNRAHHLKERLPVGLGWIESQKLPVVLGMSASHVGKICRDMVRSGEWEVFRGTKYSPTANANRTMTWYRVAQKK